MSTTGTTQDSKLSYKREMSVSTGCSFCGGFVLISMFLYSFSFLCFSLIYKLPESEETVLPESLDKSAAACAACLPKKPSGELLAAPQIPSVDVEDSQRNHSAPIHLLQQLLRLLS